MKRVGSMTILCTVICLVRSVAVPAEPKPPKEDAPAATAASAAPAVSEAAPADTAAAEPAASEPAASKPARVDQATQAAIADWAKKLATRPATQGRRLTVGDLCEVKHYKQDKLQGFGLVLDLEKIVSRGESASEKEAGAPDTGTSLTELLTLLNATVGEGGDPPALPEAFRTPDVLTLVAVTATIPPEGVRKDDRIDCEVRALGGKSVEDGYLLATQLSPPGPKMEAPAALAAGPVVRDGSYRSGPAKVLGGCLVQTDVCDQFVKDQKITLILDEAHAEFPVAQDLVNLINAEMGVAVNQPLAKAPNRFNVEVTVPESFADDPVAFITLVLRLETQIPAPEEESEQRTFRSPGGIR